MASAQLEKTDVTILISNRPEYFVAKGEVLKFDGFLKVYGGGKDDTLLPSLTNNQTLLPKLITAVETYSRPPARYSEAALVKKLEELGIGRPSTYASVISTIQSRGYVEKTDIEGIERSSRQLILQNSTVNETTNMEIAGEDRNKLIPTHLAEVTTDFLEKYFPSIVDYDFTANTENELDSIANGRQVWNKMVGTFYKSFHPLVQEAGEASRKEVSQARLIGKDPKTNLPIYARFGRYGPVLQRGESEDDQKPTFAPLPPNTKIETVTLEQALEMLKLPRMVGKTKSGEEIRANIGRFGPYVQIGKQFIAIKPLDPRTITESEAIQLFEDKLKQDAKRVILSFPSGIRVLMGPYGPYVNDGKKNARISKNADPKKLTEEECRKLLEEAPAKKRGFRRKRPVKKISS